MVSQIVSTVDYLREKRIIDENQRVHAIISFPKLMIDFNSTLFSYVKKEWSVENLIVTKKSELKLATQLELLQKKE